ncbi:MAG TPA: diguanylate cyclase, partial [Dongiaceae bacterium]|nr:diguanylate cyclase [Dongiaceae bacterium]
IILYELAVTGYGGRYLWADMSRFQGMAFSLFAGVSFLCAGLYIRNFLRLKKRGGWLLHLNTYVVGYWVLSTLVTLFYSPVLLRKFGDPMALVTCVAGLTTTIHLWRLGDVSAKYFTIAWGQLILATMGVVLMFEGVLPYDHVIEKAQVVGFMLETMLLSFALAERINRERRQREQLQKTALDMTRQASEERRAKLEAQAEAFSLQQRHTEELELRVLDRTAELERTMRNLELANRELAKLSMTDPLTGLHNRRYFDEVLASEILRGQRQQTPLSLVLVDVDHFKRINDTYGHLIGDECLKLVATTLRQVVARGTDLVARYGGEEFAVILPATSEDDARQLAERIRVAIEKTQFIHTGKRISLHASLGIAGRIPLLHESSARLIAAADEALYRAKEAGRNQVMVAGLAQSQ